jgi:hypothetical protein
VSQSVQAAPVSPGEKNGAIKCERSGEWRLSNVDLPAILDRAEMSELVDLRRCEPPSQAAASTLSQIPCLGAGCSVSCPVAEYVYLFWKSASPIAPPSVNRPRESYPNALEYRNGPRDDRSRVSLTIAGS